MQRPSRTRSFVIDHELDRRLEETALLNRVAISDVIRTGLMRLIAADLIARPQTRNSADRLGGGNIEEDVR
jgi:hypothetical protein